MTSYLIACDLDGTLLLHGHPENPENDIVPPRFFPVLKRLEQKGVRFCVATGRSYTAVRELFGETVKDICAISENGACIYDRDELVHVIGIPDDLARSIVESLRGNPDYAVRVNTTEAKYYVVPDEASADRMREIEYPEALTAYSYADINGTATQISIVSYGDIRPIAEKLIPLWEDKIHLCIAGEQWLDFIPAGKSEGLQWIAGYLGIPLENTIAFGDNFNDIEMLQAAGTGYLMDSAESSLLPLVEHLCSDVTDTLVKLEKTLFV